MSDSEPTPDDLLVSAVLDGVASADEAERVASDPRLTARLTQFRAVAEAVGGPVPLVDTAVRDAHLARARAAHQSGEQGRAAHQSGEQGRAAHQSGEPEPGPAVAGAAASAPPPASPSPPPPPRPTATTTPPPIDLAEARAQRRRPRSTVILSVAAAVVLVVAAGAVLVRLAGSTGTGGGDAEVAATVAEEPPSADSAESGASEFVPAPDTGNASGGGDATTSGAPATTVPASGIDPSLPSLGSFTKAGDLAAQVRGELTLEPQPTGLVADESCGDDFGVEVLLLGRASVGGDEGLVYVEAAPATPRRLWLVDPGTVGADDACRQVVPVQTL